MLEEKDDVVDRKNFHNGEMYIKKIPRNWESGVSFSKIVYYFIVCSFPP